MRIDRYMFFNRQQSNNQSKFIDILLIGSSTSIAIAAISETTTGIWILGILKQGLHFVTCRFKYD